MSAQREAFEAHPMISSRYLTRDSAGDYKSSYVYDAWELWQAAQAAMPVDLEIAELSKLNAELTGILGRTAKALRGRSKLRAKQTWGDVPERAEQAITACNALGALVDDMQEELDAQEPMQADAARYQHLRRNVEAKHHRNKQGLYEFEFPVLSTAADITLDGIDQPLGEAIDAEIARAGAKP